MKSRSGRMITCCLAAAVVPDMLFIFGAWFDGNSVEFLIQLFAFALAITLAYILVFGFPAYFILRRLNLIRWWTSIISGFLIGSIPTGLLWWLSYQPEKENTGMTSREIIHLLATGGHQPIAPLFPALFIPGICSFGFLGMTSGLTAWAAWRLTAPKAS